MRKWAIWTERKGSRTCRWSCSQTASYFGTGRNAILLHCPNVNSDS